MRTPGNTEPEIKEMIQKILAKKIGIDYSGLDNKIDWENLELLTKTWDSYFRNKLIVNNSVIRLNDFFDLINMAYVTKEDLYWTNEKQWYGMMNANIDTSHFDFNLKLV